MKKSLKISKDLTPKDMYCGIGACPAIFETNNGSYAIVGKVLDAKSLGVSNRVGKNEVLIEVPRKLLGKRI